MTVFTHSVLFWDTHFIQTCTWPSAQKALGLKGLTQDTDTILHSTLEYRIYHLISSVQLRHSALSYSTITHDGSSHEMCMACVVLNVRSSFRMTMVHVNRDYQGVSQFCDIEKWGLMDLCQIEGCFMSLSFGTSP